MKKKLIFFLVALAFLLPAVSQAYVAKSDDFIYISKDEVVDGNFYFKAQSITVEGVINGDFIGIAPNIQINGEVKGDLISVSQNISINGQVLGSLRAVSNNLIINGTIEKNVTALGETIMLGESGHILKDFSVKALSGEFRGLVEGSLHGGLSTALISGEIKKDLRLKMDKKEQKKYFSNLTIEEGAIILGDLNYRAGNDADIRSENILGEIKKESPQKGGKINNFSMSLYILLSSLLVALLLTLFFKEKIEKTKKIIAARKTSLALPGSVFLFLSPIASLIILGTIIGIPVALITLALWLIAIFLSRIIVAIFIGDYIFHLLKKEKVHQLLKTSLGVILCFSLFALPFVGWLLSFLATITGLGAIYFLFKKEKNENKSVNL